MKIADETLDALFDMELPLPRPVVRSLAEGIDTILQKCALLSHMHSILSLEFVAAGRNPLPVGCACLIAVQDPGSVEMVCKPTVTTAGCSVSCSANPYCGKTRTGDLLSELKDSSSMEMCCRYVDALMQGVGNPASLKPPLPPLTRYKRDVVTKLQAMDSDGSLFRGGSTRPASGILTKCVRSLSFIGHACVDLACSLLSYQGHGNGSSLFIIMYGARRTLLTLSSLAGSFAQMCRLHAVLGWARCLLYRLPILE